jgi:GTPase SAR1 family protein/Ca2+-binding EF-hand superfamily protein
MLVLNGSPPRESVDIVVVGDMGAGKTSLITTLVSSIFPEAVPRVLQQVRVPPEETADHIALSITDTSSAEADRVLTMKQVALADVVVLVYAADREDAFARVASVWLPEICKVFGGSIVVVGNKSDLGHPASQAAGGKAGGSGSKQAAQQPPQQAAQQQQQQQQQPSQSSSLATAQQQHVAMPAQQSAGDAADALRRKVSGLLAQFRQVDACWECSAKLNINVSEVFSLAQQAVVYPIAPLFDTASRELRPKLRTALLRVFRVFDQDRDGVLSDSELNDFQETCFGARLQPSDIEDVKVMLQGEGQLSQFGITFEGYLAIHRKFIERNRAETSWLVLRQFGYDDNLDLMVPKACFALYAEGEGSNAAAEAWRAAAEEPSAAAARVAAAARDPTGKEALAAAVAAREAAVARERSVELSKRTLTFLADLFHQFDKDKDQALDVRELAELFAICPWGLAPWQLPPPPPQSGGETGHAAAAAPAAPARGRGGSGVGAGAGAGAGASSGSSNRGGSGDNSAAANAAAARQGLVSAEQAFADLRLGPPNRVCCELGDFPHGTRTDERGNITLAGWLAQWAMVTLLQPRLTLLYLYFLGLDCREACVQQTRPRSEENESNGLRRNVVRALVFGAQGVGKSALLDALVGNSAQPQHHHQHRQHVFKNNSGLLQSQSSVTLAAASQASSLLMWGHADVEEPLRRLGVCRSAVSRVRIPQADAASSSSSGGGGGDGNPAAATIVSNERLRVETQKHLVMTEVAPEHDALEEALGQRMADCDLAVLVFDATNPGSVDWLRGVQLRIPETVPCVYLAAKVDLIEEARDEAGAPTMDEPAPQRDSAGISEAMEEAMMLCAAHSLPAPEPVSLLPEQRKRTTRLFELLLSVALRPDAARPISEQRRAEQRRGRMLRAALRLSLVTSVVVSSGLLIWSWTRGSSAKSSQAANDKRPVNLNRA